MEHSVRACARALVHNMETSAVCLRFLQSCCAGRKKAQRCDLESEVNAYGKYSWLSWILLPRLVNRALAARLAACFPVAAEQRYYLDLLNSCFLCVQEIPKKQLLPILDANGIPYNEKKISVSPDVHACAFLESSL